MFTTMWDSCPANPASNLAKCAQPLVVAWHQLFSWKNAAGAPSLSACCAPPSPAPPTSAPLGELARFPQDWIGDGSKKRVDGLERLNGLQVDVRCLDAGNRTRAQTLQMFCVAPTLSRPQGRLLGKQLPGGFAILAHEHIQGQLHVGHHSMVQLVQLAPAGRRELKLLVAPGLRQLEQCLADQ